MVEKVKPITMFPDSLSLLDVLTNTTVTTENRLMIDLSAMRDSFKNMKIKNVEFILSAHNLADPFTKINTKITIMTVSRCSTISNPIQQWVIRNEMNRDGSVDKEGNV